jgi:endoglucanase
MILAAEKAYQWAVTNPQVFFTNPTGVGTGEYRDNSSSAAANDEFVWARAELLITTGKPEYYTSSDLNFSYWIPSWANVAALGLVSYSQNPNAWDVFPDSTTVVTKVRNLANYFLTSYNNSAYKVAMGQNQGDFSWGSNSIAGNQAFILIDYYRLSKDQRYLDAAISDIEYVLGRNPAGYSFITGYGDNSPMSPHHRPSASDGITEPVPGLVVGGPGNSQAGDCPNYPSALPAKHYLDAQCSYSTNEPAINYNSSVVYAIGAVEALRENASFIQPAAILSKANTSVKTLSVFPNPSSGIINYRFKANTESVVEVIRMTGETVYSENRSGSGIITGKFDISNLEKGIYLLKATSGESVEAQKIIIQ